MLDCSGCMEAQKKLLSDKFWPVRECQLRSNERIPFRLSCGRALYSPAIHSLRKKRRENTQNANNSRVLRQLSGRITKLFCPKYFRLCAFFPEKRRARCGSGGGSSCLVSCCVSYYIFIHNGSITLIVICRRTRAAGAANKFGKQLRLD
jgi:hypothetical protein